MIGEPLAFRSRAIFFRATTPLSIARVTTPLRVSVLERWNNVFEYCGLKKLRNERIISSGFEIRDSRL